MSTAIESKNNRKGDNHEDRRPRGDRRTRGEDEQPREERRGGQKGKNPFAKDPVQKELDGIQKRILEINGIFKQQLEAIAALDDSEFNKIAKSSRTYLKENVYNKLDEIKAEETQIRASMTKQSGDKKKMFTDAEEIMPSRQLKGESFDSFVKRNGEFVDQDIVELQKSLLNVRSLAEEKQVVSAIEKAKSQRRKISEFEGLKTTVVTTVNSGARLDELKAQRTSLSADLTQHKAIIDKNQNLHNENYKKIQAIRAELNGLKAEREKLSKHSDELREVLNSKWTEWKKEQSALRKKRDLEEKARRAEEEAAKKLEEAEKPPLVKELKDCEDAIEYLSSLRYNKKKPNAKLNLSLESFGLFQSFGLVPPTTGQQIVASKQSLLNKKAEILATQKAALEKRAAEAAVAPAEEVAPVASAEVAPVVDVVEVPAADVAQEN